MASVPFCNLLRLCTDYTRTYFHEEMPYPITLLKQHLNRPSKELQQRFGSASLAGDTQGCRVLCKWIGLQRNLEPLMYVLPSAGPLFILDRPEGELKTQHVLRRRLLGNEGAD